MPKAIPSYAARNRWPRPCRRVSPATTPRALGSKSGVRSPAKYGSSTSPSAPAGVAAASATSCSNGTPPSSSCSHAVRLPEVLMPAASVCCRARRRWWSRASGATRSSAQDLHEEHRRAVHEHEVARAPDPRAEGLGPGVDGACADRRARRQAGLLRAAAVTVPTTSPGQARRGSAMPGQPGPAPSPAPSGPSPCRRAGRTGWRCGGPGRTRRSAGPRRRSWS